MPAFDGVLTDAQIVAVLSWIKSTWPPRQRDLQRQVDEAERKNAAASH
jgi:mono/diheme cytochrome c family protein